MTGTKIALAAALLMSTATVGMAEPAKRSPALASGAAKHSTPMRTNQGRDIMSMQGGNLMMNVMDRASSPFACGG
jgi:hypothetical protein